MKLLYELREGERDDLKPKVIALALDGSLAQEQAPSIISSIS